MPSASFSQRPQDGQDGRVGDPAAEVEEGQELKVRIISVDKDTGRPACRGWEDGNGTFMCMVLCVLVEFDLPNCHKTNRR